TPLIKLKDKGYNCFSQRMTTLRQEASRKATIETVIEAIREGFEAEFTIILKDSAPDELEKKSIQRLIKKRYKTQEWIFSHKHPRARMGIGQLKTKGGLLEVYLSLSGGSIENVVITGDFFTTSQDLYRLENALKWTSARGEIIEKNLASVWYEDMIHGLDVHALTKAILKAKENQVRL
ncbi:lipoate protein ligase C-terminal domain-containing protein, partial [Thermodesulfobacteriota bacterium]